MFIIYFFFLKPNISKMSGFPPSTPYYPQSGGSNTGLIIGIILVVIIILIAVGVGIYFAMLEKSPEEDDAALAAAAAASAAAAAAAKLASDAAAAKALTDTSAKAAADAAAAKLVADAAAVKAAADAAAASTTITSSGSTTGSCNATGCNNLMRDWIVNKYWAFDGLGAECTNCPKRGFKAPFVGLKDGVWTNCSTKEGCYNHVKLPVTERFNSKRECFVPEQFDPESYGNW